MKSYIYSLSIVILLILSVSLSQATKAKCPGHFGRGAANLCASHFPDAQSEKVWLVKFYAPWCGHCNSMKDTYNNLGKFFKDDKEVGIGAVDCTAQENQALCQKYGVQGYPTLKGFVNGKPKAYNGGRDMESMKQFVMTLKKNKGTAGGSVKCQKGVFKSAVKDSVVPLCSKHFPDDKSRNSWVVVFYNQASFPQKDFINSVALQLGNEPSEKIGKNKKLTKQRDRLATIGQKYSLSLSIPDKGLLSSQPLMRVGGVCCDCDEESKTFCQSKNISQFPSFQINQKGKALNPSKAVEKEQDLMEFVLEKIGVLNNGKKDDL